MNKEAPIVNLFRKFYYSMITIKSNLIKYNENLYISKLDLYSCDILKQKVGLQFGRVLGVPLLCERYISWSAGLGDLADGRIKGFCGSLLVLPFCRREECQNYLCAIDECWFTLGQGVFLCVSLGLLNGCFCGVSLSITNSAPLVFSSCIRGEAYAFR